VETEHVPGIMIVSLGVVRMVKLECKCGSFNIVNIAAPFEEDYVCCECGRYVKRK
jgi:hypothetical protein